MVRMTKRQTLCPTSASALQTSRFPSILREGKLSVFDAALGRPDGFLWIWNPTEILFAFVMAHEIFVFWSVFISHDKVQNKNQRVAIHTPTRRSTRTATRAGLSKVEIGWLAEFAWQGVSVLRIRHDESIRYNSWNKLMRAICLAAKVVLQLLRKNDFTSTLFVMIEICLGVSTYQSWPLFVVTYVCNCKIFSRRICTSLLQRSTLWYHPVSSNLDEVSSLWSQPTKTKPVKLASWQISNITPSTNFMPSRLQHTCKNFQP